jgi:chitinase
MPMVPKPVSDTRVAMARLAIIVTVCAWLAYTVMWFFSDFFHPGYEGAVARTEEVLYLVIVTLLTVSAVAYLLARLGFMYRTRTHHRATRASLDQYYDARRPTLTTIIPSYQEEERVIRTTLLSAALQEYPDKQVVLLIDDPYVPKNQKAREQQESARALPGKIERLLAEPARRFAGEMQSFELALQRGDQPSGNSMLGLASAYGAAVDWLENLADRQEITDHTDEFFVNEIVLRLADSFREVKDALLESAAEGVVLHPQMFRRLYRRLVWTFSVRVASFERKKYVSLSHEPNKAMNLNSYLGLMGGTYHEIQTAGGTALVPAQPGLGKHVQNPDYVVTLDADSVLLPEYCLRLVHQTWFAPYVDVTLTPTYQFQSTSADPARQSVLGFVVAASKSDCTPSWGGAYTLTTADQQLAVGARIAQLQQEGEQAIVSFGGQANTSLDVACATAAGLTSAYQSVISAYDLTTIDLDIEGAALDNYAAGQRRAQAIAALEKADPKLSVWLTLPVEPSGLQDNALSVIQSMLRDRVSIAGVNVMTMDFTTPPGTRSTMGQLAEKALSRAAGQLATLYPEYGIHLRSQQIWQRLGATVMIGQNDVQGENFTVNDAQALVGFASRNHLGRLSMWSINRDSQCGTSFPETGLLSNTCSGTAQSGLQFAQVFGQFQGNAVVSSSAGEVQPAVADTNPANAPYPQWSATASYPLGYKVVENGEIYQAKWYNSGDDPSAQVQDSWQTPWELLGPVLPSDHAPSIATLPAGTYPAWSVGTQYQAGDQVLYQGLPYQAKWSNQGTSPGTESSDPAGSPWEALYSIPGEPAGASAAGGSSPSPSASPSPSVTAS